MAAKLDEARKLVRTLMGPRLQISPTDMRLILQSADGVVDRLLSRLRTLAKDKGQFDSVLELRAQIYRMVMNR